MKVTLIITVKNEEKSIELFLDSIAKQTQKPDEIIIVDAFSTDRTLQIVSKFHVLGSKIKVLQKGGNRSIGRNFAIKKASNNIILCTDAGCILDSHWVERISTPFKNNKVDVVAGFYKPKTSSTFEKCLSTYTCTMLSKLDRKNFLPSSRSVAFRVDVWKKAGGYPEELDTCEDLVFDKRLKEVGAKFTTEERAFVYWPQRKNIFLAAHQFFSYALGDGRAHYFRKTTPLLFGRYILGGILLVFALLSINYYLLTILFLLFLSYMSWSIWKNYRYVKKQRAFIYLPLLQLTSDIAVLSGTTIGFLNSL